ncbi:MAG: TonB-dependent receptor [Aureispira sp.]
MHNYLYALLSLTIFFLLPSYHQAQDVFTIKGQLVDPNQNIIEVGNVLVLSPPDSSLIKGTYILDGQFELEGINQRPFLLQLTALGYKDSTFLITQTPVNGLLDLGKLSLSMANNLQTITVESTIPMFKSSRGKIIVNVENSLLSSSGSVLDVLQRSPRVMVNANDEVTMFGKGTPILLLDGQPTTPKELKDIPSTEIKEIEIIRNPSARYDAAGRAVINIITKRQNLEGYNARAYLQLTQGRYFYGFGSLRFNYKKKRWSVTAGYGFNYRDTWNSNYYARQYPGDSSRTFTMLNQIDNRTTTPQGHYYSFKLGYRPDSVSLLGLQYRGSHTNQRYRVYNTNNIDVDGQDFNDLIAQTNGATTRFNNSVNLNYTRDLDTLDSELFIAAQYSNYQLDTRDNIDQFLTTPNDTSTQLFQNNSLTSIHLVNGQLDYTKGFKNNMQFQAGVKGAAVLNSSSINFLTQNNQGEWIVDNSFTNGYRYNESIYAAYIQGNWEHKKWFFQAGARTEWALMNGFDPVTDNQILKRDYWHIFPTALMEFNFAENWQTALNYKTSIERPSFRALNPFIDFIDQYSVSQGNPFLVPAYNHSLEWSLTFMEMASLEVELNRSFEGMDIFIQKEGNRFGIITQNYDKLDELNVTLNLPYELKWWTTYNSFGFSYTNVEYDRGNDLLNYNIPSFYVYSYNAFKFPKVVNFEVTFQYVSAGAEGFFSYQPFSMLGFSLERKFLDDKLSVRLSVNDLLFGYREAGNDLVDVFDVQYVNRYDTRFVRLALSYSFGKLKAQGLKDRSVNKSESSRID